MIPTGFPPTVPDRDGAQRVAWWSVTVNLLLVGIKAILAALTGSLAIRADALHSLTDVAGAGIVLLGIRLSRRESPRFPYGLYKVENLVALGTALLLLGAGYEILTEAFGQASPPPPTRIPLAAAGIGATIAIGWLFSRYELRKARETGSPALAADARHVRADMLSSMVILASLFGSAAGLAVDRYAAVAAVVFVTRSAWVILVGAVRVLLDASLDYESLEGIRRVAESDPRVVAVKELRARNAGRYKFVELIVVVTAKALAKGHHIAEEIESRIKASVANVDRVIIHYEPSPKDRLTVGVPLCADRRTVSEHFGEAPYFRLVTVDQASGEVRRDAVLQNPYLSEDKAKGIKAAQWLLREGLDRLVVRRDLVGRGPGFVFGDADVEVLVADEPDAERSLSIGGVERTQVPGGSDRASK